MKRVERCDYCKQEIKEHEKVKLCGDGAVVHTRCLNQYAVKQLEPLTMSIEEIISNEE